MAAKRVEENGSLPLAVCTALSILGTAVGCASAPLTTPTEESVLVTVADLGRLGFQPAGRVVEAIAVDRPTPTSAWVEYGGAAPTMMLKTHVGVYDSAEDADRELDRLARRPLDGMEHLARTSGAMERRDDLFRAGDDSSLLVAGVANLPIHYLFRMRSGTRVFFLYLVKDPTWSWSDSPALWHDLLEPHVRALERIDPAELAGDLGSRDDETPRRNLTDEL